MEKNTLERPAPTEPPARHPRHDRDLEDDADRFEEQLAAEMLRTGAIELW